MQLRNDVSLNAIINSLSKIVLPAVDANNALAQEQLQISIGLLQLMAARAPLEFDYDCDELKRLIEFSCQLMAAIPAAQNTEELQHAVKSAERVVEQARSAPSEIRDLIAALRVATGVLISNEYETADKDTRDAIGRVVLTHADAQLLRERSWVAQQGWELRPEEVPDIETLIAPRKSRGD